MHIVFVNATKIWSGVKTWILTLGKALAQRGHQVSIVAYPGPFVDVCRQQGLDVLPLRFGFDGNPWVMARLIRWFTTHQADYVVTNIDKDIYVAGVASRCVGAHVVNHVGTPSEVKATGKKAILRANLVDLFVFPSAWAAQTAQADVAWLRQHRTAVLHNPVDHLRFAPRATPRDDNAPAWRIGITGRLTTTKGHATLIDALRLLPPEILAHMQVDIAGDGPLEDDLRARVQDAQLTETVHFVGFVTDPERILQGLDIAVFPSRADSFCLAALEAMACGLPVVASAVQGIPEVVQDGTTGLLVPPDDPQQLAAALTRLCRQPELRHQLGRQARLEVEQRFTVATIVQQFEVLCARLSDDANR